jgi:molybdate transport system substrate-binding protein
MGRLLGVLVALSVAVGRPVSAPRPASPITVAAAVSLTEVLTAAAEEYPDSSPGQVRFNFAASNILARQIVSGAPVDLFISADESQMDVVAKAGLIVDGTRVDLLTNQLAVIVPDDRPRTFSDVKDLADPAFKRIAIGDPAAVPAGVYAKQYLEREGVWSTVQSRIVPTVSVRGALAAVETGAADAAIVYRTDALVARRATIAWLVPLERGPRIAYPAAVIRRGVDTTETKRFVAFLRGEAGSRVFGRFGFSLARTDR